MEILSDREIDKIINEYINKTTWFVKTSSRKIEKTIERKYVVDKGFLVIFRVDRRTYQLPIICSENTPVDKILKSNYFVKHDSLYCIEAEYSTNYFNFMKEAGVEYRDFNTIDYDVVYSEPLVLDVQNTIGKHVLSNGLEIIVKGYRMLDTNLLEPLMFTKLTLENYNYIPRLYRTYYLDLGSDRRYLSIVIEYVRGESLEEIYVSSLKNSLKTSRNTGTGVQVSDVYSYSLRIGYIVADLHLKINRSESKDFFGYELVSEKDIRQWIKRIERRYDNIISETSVKIEKLELLEESEKKLLYSFIDELDSRRNEVIDYVSSVLDKYFIDSYKGRVHQDLALSRIRIDSETGCMKIIDFEGERFREVDELLVKEPLIRDLATLINSYYSVATHTYISVHSKRSLLKNIVKLQKQKHSPVRTWIVRNTIYLIYGYSGYLSSYDTGRKIINYGEKRGEKILLRTHYHILLTPWIIDRALYEALRMLRRGTMDFIIPLSIINNPVFPLS